MALIYALHRMKPAQNSEHVWLKGHLIMSCFFERMTQPAKREKKQLIEGQKIASDPDQDLLFRRHCQSCERSCS